MPEMLDFQKRGIRPVWLASYPRSGNTYLRIILEKVFRFPSYSLYLVEGQDFPDPSAEALEEAPKLPAGWRCLLTKSAEAEPLLIKTHGLPEDDSPAIYIIRDGRPTIHSYFHYHKNFGFEQPSLTEVIAGACQFGSWSSHYLSWKPRTSPNTLFIRYEYLVEKPAEIIQQLSKFLHREPMEGRIPTFQELRTNYPKFFRRGQNQDFLAEWLPGQVGLFNQLHGPVMAELGYTLTNAPGPTEAEIAELAASAERLHRVYMLQLEQSGQLNSHYQTLFASYQGLQASYQGLQASYQDLQANYQGLQANYQGLQANYQGLQTKHRGLMTNRWVKLGKALRIVREE